MIAWEIEGLDGGFVTDATVFAESSEKTYETVSHYLSISAVMCFWSAWKGKVVNVIEMLTDKCVEVWENLRLDPYSNERSLCVWKWVLRLSGGGTHEVMLVRWGFFAHESGLLLPQGRSKPHRGVAGQTQKCSLNSKILLVL